MTLGFTFRTAKDGVVRIARDGREVTVLRGAAARRFLERAEGATAEGVQQLCARVTGNDRRGNEGGAAATRGSKRGP